MLEKTFESPLDCKEIQPVHPKGGQTWVFIGRTDVEAETPILWPPDAKSWVIGKDPDAGKDWGQEKGMTEDEMAGWHHWLDGHGFGWTPGVGDGQEGLVCYRSWGHKESDVTERVNWTELMPGLMPKWKEGGSFMVAQWLRCGFSLPWTWALSLVGEWFSKIPQAAQFATALPPQKKSERKKKETFWLWFYYFSEDLIEFCP